MRGWRICNSRPQSRRETIGVRHAVWLGVERTGGWFEVVGYSETPMNAASLNRSTAESDLALFPTGSPHDTPSVRH